MENTKKEKIIAIAQKLTKLSENSLILLKNSVDTLALRDKLDQTEKKAG